MRTLACFDCSSAPFLPARCSAFNCFSWRCRTEASKFATAASKLICSSTGGCSRGAEGPRKRAVLAAWQGSTVETHAGALPGHRSSADGAGAGHAHLSNRLRIGGACLPGQAGQTSKRWAWDAEPAPGQAACRQLTSRVARSACALHSSSTSSTKPLLNCKSCADSSARTPLSITSPSFTPWSCSGRGMPGRPHAWLTRRSRQVACVVDAQKQAGALATP